MKISIKKIKHSDGIYYYFHNLKSNNFNYIAYLTAKYLKAEVIETFIGFDAIFIRFRKDTFIFELFEDNYIDIHFKLIIQNKKDNDSLELLANELLTVMKIQNKSLVSKKVKDWFEVAFKKPLDMWRNH